jgi:hypothetical protein
MGMSASTSQSANETSSPMKLVEVYTITDPNLAELIKATLQRDGISC